MIDWNFRIESECLTITLAPDAKLHTRASIHKEQGHVTLLLPADFDFSMPERQLWLQKAILEQVRSYAKGILPARLRALAQEMGVEIEKINVNAPRTRWGSCSCKMRRVGGLAGLFTNRKERSSGFTINLSLYLLLLPERLQRLVMLHELTHTFEMNHSPRFHERLNALLGGQEKALERELKEYRPDLMWFAGNYSSHM